MTEGVFDGYYHEQYPFPHCNAEVLHAPGECYYCDHYPDRQAARKALGTPFTPNEANGWSGNVAVKAGETLNHMGARFVVGDQVAECLSSPCTRNVKVGWYCRRNAHADGPCALVPRWWNLAEHLRGL